MGKSTTSKTCWDCGKPVEPKQCFCIECRNAANPEFAGGFTLERAPAVEQKPETFANNTGEQLTMFVKGSDWKPRHRDLFDVEGV